MKPVSEVYTGTFFKQRYKLEWRDSLVCDAIIKTLKPGSIFDVGCGDGAFVGYFNRQGILARGVEGSIHALKFLRCGRNFVFISDLREKLDCVHHRDWDLCMSLEVAEHIEPEFAEIYVDNLCRHSENILISCAPPEQGGHGHVNCQPIEYWDGLFEAKGYKRNKNIVQLFREEWEPHKNKKGMNAYYQNIAFYRLIHD